MALVPCPSCGLPRTASDADAAPCPACGWKAGDPVVAAAPEVAPAPTFSPPLPPAAEPHGHRNRWLLGGVLAVVAGVFVALFAWPGDPPHDPTAGFDTRPPQEVVVAPPGEPQLPVAPPPREVGAVVPDPVIVAIPVPVPSAEAGGVAVIRVDRPDEDFGFPRLDAGNHVKLIGRVRKLVVDGVNGGATLDASELIAHGMTVAGDVDGGSTLLAHCATGYMTFKGNVDGGARVVVDGGAHISFTHLTRDGQQVSRVGGGSRLTIRAKSVTLAGTVTGPGTALDITLGPPGALKFATLEDGAAVRFRREHRADPPLKVTPGVVRGGAVFKELPVE